MQGVAIGWSAAGWKEVTIVKHEKATNQQRQRRRFSVRNRMRRAATRPRLTVFRSHKHIYCQLIDDEAAKTMASASTRDKEIRASIRNSGNKEAAQAVGKALAERAISAGLKDVYFDRGAYKYHGRIAALADAAREAGLNF
jgi:large subunit ribosomal protein L18